MLLFVTGHIIICYWSCYYLLLVMLLFITGHVTGECVLANVSRLTSLLLCQVCPQYSNHSLINTRKPRNESENREMSNKKFGRR